MPNDPRTTNAIPLSPEIILGAIATIIATVISGWVTVWVFLHQETDARQKSHDETITQISAMQTTVLRNTSLLEKQHDVIEAMGREVSEIKGSLGNLTAEHQNLERLIQDHMEHYHETGKPP
jgi:chromosome segregation ATPase